MHMRDRPLHFLIR